MGSGQSTFSGTPLGCMLDNWKAFRRQADYGIVLCKDNLVKFCTLEWMTFWVEWPEGGTLKPGIVQAVHSTVTRDGHWDQYPYIDIWQDLMANPPPWLQKCRSQTIKTLMARAPVRKPCPPVKKSCPQAVIPSAPDPMPPPPLYPGLPAPVPSIEIPTLSSEDNASTKKGGPSHQGSSKQESPLTSLSSSVSDCTRSKTGPVTDQSSEEQWNVSSEYRPGDTKITLTHSRSKGDLVHQGPLHRNYLCPLRETVAPGGELTMIYVPFTTSDLYNWKQQKAPFSEDPAPLTAAFETLITAHNPTWGDMRVALNTLLTAEERRLVLSRAREWVAETEGNPATVAARLPESPPDWPHDDTAGRTRHSQYATAIVQGMKRCIRKTPNWAKLYNIRQEKNENAAAFYERLCNTCKRYTDLDPEDTNGKWVLIPLFIGQSYEDIRKKLQKLEGASGKNIEELLEIAMKVYDRRDDEERKQGARVLAMALREGYEERGDKVKGRPGPLGKERGPRLGRNQCAICREEGLWKNECPRRQGPRPIPG
uniref:Core shell protein Gag P30 domain-containing protein n=1 Tax=Terrapene triunguis TaxID=2587831 RepID=A0A674JTL2_9SAUR